ncbi:hypothetical protein JZ751_021406 [Albula glossodonta]|uniref:Nitric oxide synthase n=1 Tax=Albula glossodonta TaxID=121402 RepID=A0A8T2NKL4_9TELE|nr:hypothetical protein JZ751_021406 [Albula glossodonta]
MFPKNLIRGPRQTPMPPQDVLIKDHLSRIEAVTMEIDTTGTYELTAEELAFATKQAWRNAPRCIGRIQWSNLQLFDARQCTTAQEMFHFLCQHLKVWNSQLLAYAGYRRPDGSIVGDPSKVEFTELCIELGWEPKYGLFDVLPLVLQANGGDPQLFEIPPELVLEVPLEHPTNKKEHSKHCHSPTLNLRAPELEQLFVLQKQSPDRHPERLLKATRYKWFKDLQLQWYTVPAVSSMMLEVGGLEFTACPFNGWYMGTEIGVRDLCDPHRYNILERVGTMMGLEVHKLSSLWKDQALVAVNIAVIHSFQRGCWESGVLSPGKNNVTIMDHHTAAESFMRHMEAEFRQRGGCPSDWVWLVPPMSGGLSPVFHQEMVNYILTPFYYYQPDPWVTHVWCDGRKGLKKHRLSLKGLARAVLFSSILMQCALARRVSCTVLYASETGTSQTFAKRLDSLLNQAFHSRVLCMEDYNPKDLEKEHFLIVVTSTFGSGDCPRNGEHFKKHLFGLQQLKNKFRYCVFGLGSRMYPHFCGFAHSVDDKLAELGAHRLTPTGEGDELNGQEAAFSSWAKVAFQDACEEFGIQTQASFQLPGAIQETWDPLRYRVRQQKGTLDRITGLSAVHSKDLLPMRLKRRQNLHSPQSSVSTILVELDLAGSEGGKGSLQYLPGDHVGVFPGNSSQLVTGILKHLPDAPPSNQSLQLESCTTTDPEDGSEIWQTFGGIPACTLSQALTYFLDITSPPSQSLLRKLSQLARDNRQKQRLLLLAQDSKEYSTWATFRRPTFLEVLEEFPSLQPPAAFLLSQLPLLKPRLYSVSSSADLHPTEIHLTVTVVQYHTQDGQGPLHHGVCSTWLNSIRDGDLVPCFLHRYAGAGLYEDMVRAGQGWRGRGKGGVGQGSPVILVGTGSGIAPFRAFWQQRFHNMLKKGEAAAPMTLVFGCRRSDTDHLYGEETQEMKNLRVFKTVLVAESRQHNQPKVYVQDVLREKLAAEVFRVLVQDRGYLYICGNVCMVQDVSRTVQHILAQRLGLNPSQAEEYVANLKGDHDTMKEVAKKRAAKYSQEMEVLKKNRSVAHQANFLLPWFVEKYQELEAQGQLEEEALFEATGKALLAEGLILRRKGSTAVAPDSRDPLLKMKLTDMLAEQQTEASSDAHTETAEPTQTQVDHTEGARTPGTSP